MSELQTSWEDVLSRGAWRRQWLHDVASFMELLWDQGRALGPSKRTIALVLAITLLLHVALIWLLLRDAIPAVSIAKFAAGELQVVSIQSAPESMAAVPEPVMQSPAVEQIATPQIATGAPLSDASGVEGVAQTLAPRPDPRHLNVTPKIAGAVSGLHVVLRVLVDPTGDIGDAQIAQSSGHGDIDHAVLRYIKANWSFLPAMQGGVPVSYWTTVLVPLESP